MTVSAVAISPTYPVAGNLVTLTGTSDLYGDDDISWSLTAVPNGSRLALGPIVENHPTIAKTTSVPLTFHAAVTLTSKPAFISRASGSFVTDGFKVGMTLDITSTLNAKRVTVAAVAPLILTLAATDALTAETATASLAGQEKPGGVATNRIVLDAAGEFTIRAFEWFVHPGTGGAFEGDPLAAPQKRLMSTADFTIHVGAFLDLPIEPVNGHGSTLRILVVNETVRGASLIEPKTDLARVAALDATVAAAVTALVGVAVTSLDTAFIATVDAGCAAFEAHRILVGGGPVHPFADTTNALLREAAHSTGGALVRLNDWAQKMRGHQEATTSGGVWHDEDDLLNLLQVAPTATTLAQGVVLLADLRNRVYRRHISQVDDPDSHRTADATNVLAAPATGSMAALFVAYLDYVAAATVSAPAGESEGIADAQATWGFRVA